MGADAESRAAQRDHPERRGGSFSTRYHNERTFAFLPQFLCIFRLLSARDIMGNDWQLLVYRALTR